LTGVFLQRKVHDPGKDSHVARGVDRPAAATKGGQTFG
jgi:hypothetical protein